MKRILTFLFAAMLVFNSLSVAAKSEIWSGDISESFKGEGTEKSPYVVETGEDLALLSENVYKGEEYKGKYFILENDIILNDTKKYYTWESNPPKNSWSPIGVPKSYFKGNFDGNGKKITGLYVAEEAKNYVGLFGYVKDGTIKNLILEKAYVAGRSDVGALVGYSENSVIANICAEGFVSAKENAGGIAGTLSKSKITNAISSVEVVSFGNSGGIAGYADESEINYATSKRDVRGVLTSGGIAGRLLETTVKNAYSEGEITAESYSGGIAGYLPDDSDISFAFATGNVISEKASGGIAGASYGAVKSVYFKGFTTGEYSGAVAGLNTPLSEDADMDDYGEIENAYFANDRCETAVGYTLAEEEDHEILGLKASKMDNSFIKSYILNPFISLENLKEAPDDAWMFRDKTPGLFIEYPDVFEKEDDEPQEKPSEKPEIGLKTGEVVSTDIRAYIHGNEIKAVNIAGKMAIALKDLREFGFEVAFDEEKKTVNVSYKGGEINSSYVYEESDREIGSYISDVLSTDIKAYLDGEEVESFNAEGYTHVYFRSLSAYGEISFDEDKREAKLLLK